MFEDFVIWLKDSWRRANSGNRAPASIPVSSAVRMGGFAAVAAGVYNLADYEEQHKIQRVMTMLSNDFPPNGLGPLKELLLIQSEIDAVTRGIQPTVVPDPTPAMPPAPNFVMSEHADSVPQAPAAPPVARPFTPIVIEDVTMDCQTTLLAANTLGGGLFGSNQVEQDDITAPLYPGLQTVSTGGAPRQDWLFKGSDRDLLESTLERFVAIINRAFIADDERLTTAISTRDHIVNIYGDSDEARALFGLADHFAYLLSLRRK